MLFAGVARVPEEEFMKEEGSPTKDPVRMIAARNHGGGGSGTGAPPS